jgi:hypothetical protein
VKLQRLALIGIVVLAVVYVAGSPPRGATAATTATPAPSALPLYQFVETGTEPLPWNAVSLETQLNATTMLGGPHGATDAAEGVIAYRTSTDDLALFTQNADGTVQWVDLSTGNDVPAPAGDPVPFFDPTGNVDLLYVDQTGDVQLLSPNVPDNPQWSREHQGAPWRPYVTTDLSALTGVAATTGLPSVVVAGSTATVAYRTASDDVEVLALSWATGEPTPLFSQSDYTESNPTLASSTPNAPTARSSTTTTTIPATTTTTKPPTTTTTSPPAVAPGSPFASDPVVLPGPTPTFATTLSDGDLVVYTNVGDSIADWTAENVTTATGSTPVTGALALGTSTSQIDLAALTRGGSIVLYSTQYFTASPGVAPVGVPDSWLAENLTSLTPGAPPMSGQLSVQVTLSQVAVAGQAAHWGDLFVLTNATGTTTWDATDVSVTAGSNARTVANIVTGLALNGQLTLYAAGVNTPPPQGVGVYAIPSAKWSTAITNGWPIISETGGLGTQSAPWVGFTGASGVAESPDFLMGQAIYNAHKRVTWLSFWTVSGPLANEVQAAATYYNHGFAAGVWVATQIDSYRSLGVGLKPDWVILDPEGYPDNHSHLDAPAGASKATLATYANYWSSMLSGWQAGLNSIDSSLNAAVYASQSEYANYQLSTLSMPVFVAVAFSNGGPVPVAGADGSNVRGYISFGAACSPSSKLQSEAQTLENPPWGGQFNTLQFNAGVYCAPPST